LLIENVSLADLDCPFAFTAIGIASSIMREGTFYVEIPASVSAGLGVKCKLLN
jgi:hypothetical protein